MGYCCKRMAGMALVATLVACTHNLPPVEESVVVTKPQTGQQKLPASGRVIPPTHVVERGETLYSIAFRYGLDFRALAANNRIAEPYTIYPGQKLRLQLRKASPTTAAPDAVSMAPAAAGSAAVLVPPVLAAPQAQKAATGAWQWPVPGKIIGGFNASGIGPKGIALSGTIGDPVRAARGGRVVYTGSSLVGYGQLVILKHDDVYLSAYAHNSRILVKEGDTVRAGDVIGAMGSSGSDRIQLHFEVRRNGDPIDPLSVLPRR